MQSEMIADNISNSMITITPNKHNQIIKLHSNLILISEVLGNKDHNHIHITQN